MVTCGLIAIITIYGIQLDLSIAAGAKDMVTSAKCRKGCFMDNLLKWVPVLNNETCRVFSTSEVRLGNRYASKYLSVVHTCVGLYVAYHLLIESELNGCSAIVNES